VTGYIPAGPRKVHFCDAAELDVPGFVPARGCTVSLTALADLTERECRAFGISPILKGNEDLVPARRWNDMGEAA